MTGILITPDEFTRLLALPEDHPERRRAEGSAEFVALKAMHEAFVVDTTADGAAEAIRDELVRRVLPLMAPRPVAPPARARRGDAGRRPGWLAALAWPQLGRVAACAALVLVAGVGWWASRPTRPGTDKLRGERAQFVLRVAPPRGRQLEITWEAVRGADAYRGIVLGVDLAEVAHVELGASRRWRLSADSLPAGAPAHSTLAVEVQALARGAVLATSAARTIRLP